MKHRHFLTSVLLAGLCWTAVAEAKMENNITIINHFDQSIAYTVNINPEVLPDLPVDFTLAAGEQRQSRVIDVGKDEAYIRGQDNNGHSVFFGIELANNQVIFHGYISKGIAYSWKEKTIIFCTPAEYKPKHSCF